MKWIKKEDVRMNDKIITPGQSPIFEINSGNVLRNLLLNTNQDEGIILTFRLRTEDKLIGRMQNEVISRLQKCLQAKNQAEFEISLIEAHDISEDYLLGLTARKPKYKL